MNRLMRFIVITISSCAIIMLVCISRHSDDEKGIYSWNVRAIPLDRAIEVEWNLPGNCKFVTVTITDSEKGYVQTVDVMPPERSYAFTEGLHGTLYTVSVEGTLRDDSREEIYEKNVLYLDYDKLPNMPLLVIQTSDGEEPQYEEAVKEDEELWGETITNNQYVNGSMTMIRNQTESPSMQMKWKIRGNANTVTQPKKPYKIVLDAPADLLGGGAETTGREWVLLSNGIELKTYLGTYLSNLCGVEWVPPMEFVNVMVNGDWKGCYILTTAVCYEAAHGRVSSSGYIFENDAYWWNENRIYFKTEEQLYQMGYTFKYPKIKKEDDPRIAQLQKYMQEVEDLVLAGNSDYQELIDEDTLVSWILVRDILGQGDGGGSNMYFYKYDFDLENSRSSKVKMGPLWDFDSAFEVADEWSRSRTREVFLFSKLFELQSFSEAYQRKWQSISPELAKNVDKQLEDLDRQQGNVIEESWELDEARWGREVIPLTEQVRYASEWFRYRTEWMDQALKKE